MRRVKCSCCGCTFYQITTLWSQGRLVQELLNPEVLSGYVPVLCGECQEGEEVIEDGRSRNDGRAD